ncbi:aldehyde dehydrogenase family protein [Nocardioides sp. J2M5]|uniref:aldehyde dehydrogenase family protein n=1 Tax=Nocardioides palaemonis TaxID=2829810 RepID=UPI001BA76613|nr:aldehyde dehydrogenase family protein [Nocardioides palaemonis]MBS2939744.1 aldehyde dehydrogenase family protein [Nocardioides palaemonis]
MSKHVPAPVGLPVDGREQPTVEGWTFPARNPATGEVLWQVPDAGPADVDAALTAARRAFDATPWSTDSTMRVAAVRAFRAALEDRADDLALLLAAETGVPVALREDHVDRPIAELRAVPRRLQAGVTVVVTPATSPLAVALEEIGRVLLAGGTVVLKPAVEAASAALEIGRIALDHLPRGVLNVVTTRDVDVAIALTLDRRVDEVVVAGSAVVGDRVKAVAHRPGTRVRVTVGGPRQVRAGGADMASLVAEAARAVAANAGQAPWVPSSVVVPAFRYAEARAAAVEAMAAVAVGDPTSPETLCGPLRSAVARDRVLRYVALAESERADVALGGRRLDRPGWWVEPTVIGGVAADSRLVVEEVLGPVLMLVPDASARA